jgi:hypothetical protein
MTNQIDRDIFQGIIKADSEKQRMKDTPGAVFLRVARHFLGAPYAAKTLDASGTEGLIINLRAFDCFTLVENCCAFAFMLHTGKDRFAEYAAILQSLRYRDGVIAGYPSRLHYFSDWLHNNEEAGMISDISQALGGTPFPKVLNFMTTKSGLYPPLQDPAACRQMIAIEKRLTGTARYSLPKGELRFREEGIEDGDILAVTTDQEGLDVCHVGIAAWQDGRLHLLHASEQAGQVIISPETLVDYLHQSPHRTGIMAARLAVPS